jgi:hypothetical protein
MKTIKFGETVSSRSYYYLLDFNDSDNKLFMTTMFNKTSLKDLTLEEYQRLFTYATNKDVTSNNVKIHLNSDSFLD